MLPSRNVPHETREAYRLDRFASYLAGAYQGAIFPFAGVIAREQLHAEPFVLSLMTAAPFLGHLGALFWARAMEGRPKLPGSAGASPSPSRSPSGAGAAPLDAADIKRLSGWRSSVVETFRYLVGTLGILREDRRFRWFALSVFTYGFGNLIVAPVIPLVQVDQLHISTRHIALLANLAQLTTAVSYFFWGRYVDRRGPLPTVVINIILSAFIPLCYFFADNVWMIAPAFLLSGITQAGIDLSYFNGILSFSNAENASRYQALHSFMLGIRGLTAPFIGGGLTAFFIGRGLDLRYVFLVALFFILIGCWMQLAGLRRSARPRPGVPAVAS